MTALIASGVAIAGRLAPSDLLFERGQLVALIGPNGGGKTSLLRALAGVEAAHGEVRIDGEMLSALNEARRRALLAFLPASRDLEWPIAVRDVIALGLARRDDARIAKLLALLELGPLAARPVNSLSTGERTRVLLARALAARPGVLLLDEPFANLEPYWVIRVAEILAEQRNGGALVIVALHDLGQLGRFDRVLLIDGGRVQLDKTPASMTADERFERIFRIEAGPAGWTVRPADRRSSP